MKNMRKKKLNKIIILVLSLVIILGLVAVIVFSSPIMKAKKLTKTLSLEEKIAQMIMPAFRSWSYDGETKEAISELNPEIKSALTKYGFGGVILFADNTQGTEQTVELICDMQEAALKSSSGIPLFVSVDQEGGTVTRLATGTVGCGNMALGAANDVDATEEMAGIIGSELAAEGFNINFAPVMDVNNNPDNPVIGLRSFSDDPEIVSNLGAAFIKGLHSQNIITALKHFPGHGDTVTDSHSGLPCIDKSLEDLKAFELIPFSAGIKAGTEMIMTAHIQYPQIEKETYISTTSGEEITLPATLSKTIISDLLRDEMGFKGVVTTDALGMGAISENFDPMDSAKLAINAGVDILLMPIEVLDETGLDEYGEYINGIVDMVHDGLIDEETINNSVIRILKLKYSKKIMDLVVDRGAQEVQALSLVGSKENHEKEWEITSKTITMVKNDGVLPLKTNASTTVAFFAAYSNESTAMEYAFNRLKLESVIDKATEYEVSCFTKQTELDDSQKALVNAADAIVVDVESSGLANMNPESSGGWQASFIDDLIAYSHKQGKKVVVISIKLPYDAARYQEADAILLAYSAKGMDEAPTRFTGETKGYGPNLPVAIGAVFGEYIPGGKLPVNIFKIDAKYEYSHDILYPRGFGLSYE